jgi:RimJ/RimL family protein N-acetyltransferase
MRREQLEDVEDVHRLWFGARKDNDWITNFYPDRRQIAEWIRCGELTSFAGEEGVIFFRQDRDFFHVSYSCNSVASLSVLLSAALFDEEIYVLDFISRDEVNPSLAETLNQFRFNSHRRLLRLHRSPGLIEPPARHSDSASYADALQVFDYLELHFDRYSERLPKTEEVVRAAENGQLRVIHERSELAAFAYFETNPKSATLRYWFAVPEYRDEGLAGSLLREFIHEKCGIRNLNLWVVDDNLNARNRYERYGFRPDGLVDTVYFREASL